MYIVFSNENYRIEIKLSIESNLQWITLIKEIVFTNFYKMRCNIIVAAGFLFLCSQIWVLCLLLFRIRKIFLSSFYNLQNTD